MFFEQHDQQNGSGSAELPTLARAVIGVVLAGLSATLIFALATSNKAAPNIATLAAEKLSLSGVENPVTAVLLNYRSYDTLLEIAVLLIVSVAMLPSPLSHLKQPATETRWADTRWANTQWLVTRENAVTHPVLAGLLKWLVPVAIVMGGYLLWTGAYRPGGAFQAGAVIAGAGVGLSLAGRHTFHWQSQYVRFTLCLGLLVFIGVAAINAIVTGTTLQYPARYAGPLILLVEVAATLSIAATLLLLFTRLQTMLVASETERGER